MVVVGPLGPLGSTFTICCWFIWRQPTAASKSDNVTEICIMETLWDVKKQRTGQWKGSRGFPWSLSSSGFCTFQTSSLCLNLRHGSIKSRRYDLSSFSFFFLCHESIASAIDEAAMPRCRNANRKNCQIRFFDWFDYSLKWFWWAALVTSQSQSWTFPSIYVRNFHTIWINFFKFYWIF